MQAKPQATWRKTVRSTLEESIHTQPKNSVVNQSHLTASEHTKTAFQIDLSKMQKSIVHFLPAIKSQKEIDAFFKNKMMIKHEKARLMIQAKTQTSLNSMKSTLRSQPESVIVDLRKQVFPQRLEISFENEVFKSKSILVNEGNGSISILPKTSNKQDIGRIILNYGMRFQAANKDNRHYFQYKLIKCQKINPLVFVGVVTKDFKVEQDLSRQKNVWCISLKSGDKLERKLWKQYYDMDDQDEDMYSKGDSKVWKEKKGEKSDDEEEETPEKCFKEGTVVGLLVDQQRGMISYFKDGEDLGPAFISPDLKQYEVFPFIQIQQVSCEVQIFHPDVFPEEVLEEEEESEEEELEEEEESEEEKEEFHLKKKRKVEVSATSSEEYNDTSEDEPEVPVTKRSKRELMAEITPPSSDFEDKPDMHSSF